TRLYVVDAIDKRPYDQTRRRPPWTGAVRPPVTPGPDGHFDALDPEGPGFVAASAYATVRAVLDVWDGYQGRRRPWYFGRRYRRLEVIPRIDGDNAWSRPGYIELGVRAGGPFALNFDVVAHEVGHLVYRNILGHPARRPPERRAHEEAFADLVAVVSVLHFERVARRLLQHTRGDLRSETALSRIGELGGAQEIRNALNASTMLTLRWHPDPSTFKYALSRPWTGAGFDVLLAIYERSLVRRRAIPPALAARARAAGRREGAALRRQFAACFARHEPRFLRALVDARDTFGRLLVRGLARTPPAAVNHATAALALALADQDVSGGRHSEVIVRAFQRRCILPSTP
ncbi:MAG TPA: hypothetical protein VFX28_18390, partial [Methylomirabilota bacterium]|nr:hypothetical protein [Methylomirabilota bacterium]